MFLFRFIWFIFATMFRLCLVVAIGFVILTHSSSAFAEIEGYVDNMRETGFSTVEKTVRNTIAEQLVELAELVSKEENKQTDQQNS